MFYKTIFYRVGGNKMFYCPVSRGHIPVITIENIKLWATFGREGLRASQ
jgi:hypothetical protein